MHIYFKKFISTSRPIPIRFTKDYDFKISSKDRDAHLKTTATSPHKNPWTWDIEFHYFFSQNSLPPWGPETQILLTCAIWTQSSDLSLLPRVINFAGFKKASLFIIIKFSAEFFVIVKNFTIFVPTHLNCHTQIWSR